MPSRNIVKDYAADQYYHVYNRGVEKRVIFLDDQDYVVFIGLIKKYLNGETTVMHNRHSFKRLGDEVQLLSYCLMPNYFHFLLYQTTEDAITKFMRRLATGYVMYFNNRYDRVGGLFQGKFKASHINADSYLQHISRYIHLNPKDYRAWPYSSYVHYLKKSPPAWLTTQPIMDLFDNNPASYESFVGDYVEIKQLYDEIKWQLASD